MANMGLFLGGVADGLKSATDMRQADELLGLKRDTLTADTALRTRSLDQDMSLRTRALNLQAQGQQNAQSRELLAQADKQVNDTLSVIDETITAAKAQNTDPAAVAKAIQPLVESAKRIAGAGGLNPGAIDVKVNAWMGRPTATEAAVAKVKTGVTAAKAVAAETGVPEREALQGQGVLKAEPKGDNTIEGIRTKIAAGETLSAGEKQVYDDAIRSDPLARFLALTQPGGAAPAPAAPAAAAPAAATPALPPEAAKQLKQGVVTTFGNGQKWTLQGGKPVQVK